MQAEFQRTLLTTIENTVMTGAPAIYARNFSVPEMRDLLAFYHTSTGSKFLMRAPEIAAETMALYLPAIPAMVQRLNSRFEAIIRNHAFDTK
jgi:hypothetical protein